MTRIKSQNAATPRPARSAQTAESFAFSPDLMDFARQATAFVATMATALLVGQIL